MDVGYGQLAWKLQSDPRVKVIDRCNIRYLDPSDVQPPPDFAVIDVSFISLSLVLPKVCELLQASAFIIALVKPQFEAARTEVRKGLVRDPAVHRRVLDEVKTVATAVGLTPLDSIPSPITGATRGNVELLLHLRGS